MTFAFAWMAAGLCLIAAIRDVGWRLVDNALVLSLLLLWGGFVASQGIGWQEVGGHLAVAGGAFAFMLIAYALGWIGGGDAKLAAPVFLWAGPGNAMAVLQVVALGGAFIGGLCLLAQGANRGISRMSRADQSLPKAVLRILAPLSAERGVPYGVALAMGGLVAILAAMAEG